VDAVNSTEGEEVNDDHLAFLVGQLEGFAVDPLSDLGELRRRDVELGWLTGQAGEKDHLQHSKSPVLSR